MFLTQENFYFWCRKHQSLSYFVHWIIRYNLWISRIVPQIINSEKKSICYVLVLQSIHRPIIIKHCIISVLSYGNTICLFWSEKWKEQTKNIYFRFCWANQKNFQFWMLLCQMSSSRRANHSCSNHTDIVYNTRSHDKWWYKFLKKKW